MAKPITSLQSTNTLGSDDQMFMRQGNFDRRISAELMGTLSWAKREGYTHLGTHAAGISFPDTQSFTNYQGKTYFVKRGVGLPYTSLEGVPLSDNNLRTRQMDREITYSFSSIAEVVADCPPLGSKVIVQDYYGGGANTSGVLFFTVEASGTVLVDGGKGIAVGSGKMLVQNLKQPYNVTAWGAKPKTVTEPDVLATSEIQAAANYTKIHGGQLDILDVFNISGDLDLWYIGLNCTGKLLYNNNAGMIKVGAASVDGGAPRQHIEQVSANNRDIDTPCMSIEGSRGQTVSVGYCDALRIYSNNADDTQNYSVGYNTFHLGIIGSLDMYTQAQGASAQGGWINENDIYIKSCGPFRLGRSGAGEYKHNHNRFHGGVYESAASSVQFINAQDSIIYNARFENALPDAISFGEDAWFNNVQISWAGSDASRPIGASPRSIDDGIGNTVTSAKDADYQNYPICDVSRATFLRDPVDGLKVNLYGTLSRGIDQVPAAESATNLVLGTGYTIDVGNWQPIYRQDFIPVDPSRDTWISAQMKGATTLQGFRLYIYGWDKDMNPLTPAAGDLVVPGQGDIMFGETNSANVQLTRMRVNRKGCSYISVVLRNGDQPTNFLNIKCSVRMQKAPSLKVVGGVEYYDESSAFLTCGNVPNIF